MLGRSKQPKAIRESAGYTAAAVTLVGREDGREYVLERHLDGGDAEISTAGKEQRRLRAKHSAKRTDNISVFLLELSGLAGQEIRTTGYGATRSLSFRDIVPLAYVDEESVISARSPILSGQNNSKTSERRVFHLVLTGTDDASVVAQEKPQLVKSRNAGRAEALTELLRSAQVQVSDLGGGVSLDVEEAQQQLKALTSEAKAASLALAEAQQAAAPVERRRHEVWTTLRAVESRYYVRREIQTRFELLREQYQTDLERLAAIAETGGRLLQLSEERCPVCGSAAEHHQHDYAGDQSSPADVALACQAETVKTAKLLRDLETTLKANQSDIEELIEQRDARATEFERTDAELRMSLQPRVAQAVRCFRDIEARRAATSRAVDLLTRERELQCLLDDVTMPTASQFSERAALVSTPEAELFAQEVEKLLRNWSFPDVDRVVWSEDDEDVVISGRPRGSRGKGVRAITRAAFNLALLRLCADQNRPFPGFVILDSPLVVYSQPESAEDRAFPQAVKDLFFTSIAAAFRDEQVVIIENDKPPDELYATENIIVFTGNETGRSGFIPT